MIVIFSKLLKKWVKVARVIGDFQAQIFFSIFYLVILSIPGIITRFVSDPLDIKKQQKKSQFIDWTYKPDTLQSAHKPF